MIILNTLRAELFIAFVTFKIVAIITTGGTARKAKVHFCAVDTVVSITCMTSNQRRDVLSIDFADVAVVFQTTVTGVEVVSIELPISFSDANPPICNSGK